MWRAPLGTRFPRNMPSQPLNESLPVASSFYTFTQNKQNQTENGYKTRVTNQVGMGGGEKLISPRQDDNF